MNNKNNACHKVTMGKVARCAALVSLLFGSSAVYAKDVQYVVTLGMPTSSETNAEEVTFLVGSLRQLIRLN